MDYTQSKEVKALNRNEQEISDSKGLSILIYKEKAG